MKFTKMHGAGNDYIYVDCFRQPISVEVAGLAGEVSDRRFGVGGDGLVLICPAEGADAEMRMFNADGSYSEMCGNGIRCVAKYVYDHGIARRETLNIMTAGRMFELELMFRGGKVDRVRVDMGEPILTSSEIPTTLPGDPPTDAAFEIAGRKLAVTCVSMGNPHCVVFVDEPADEVVWGVGPQIETDPRF